MSWIPWIVVALNAIASIFWGVEARRAHNQQIAAKDAALLAKEAQIDSLRELTSTQVREHYLATKAQLEAYIEQLQDQANRLQQIVDKREADVETLLDEVVIARSFLSQAEESLRVLKKDFRESVGRSHRLDSAGVLAEYMVESGSLTRNDADAILSGTFKRKSWSAALEAGSDNPTNLEDSSAADTKR